MPEIQTVIVIELLQEMQMRYNKLKYHEARFSQYSYQRQTTDLTTDSTLNTLYRAITECLTCSTGLEAQQAIQGLIDSQPRPRIPALQSIKNKLTHNQRLTPQLDIQQIVAPSETSRYYRLTLHSFLRLAEYLQRRWASSCDEHKHIVIKDAVACACSNLTLSERIAQLEELRNTDIAYERERRPADWNPEAPLNIMRIFVQPHSLRETLRQIIAIHQRRADELVPTDSRQQSSPPPPVSTIQTKKQITGPTLAEKLAQCDTSQFPNVFFCPITRDIMQAPVVAADGHTYEQEAIKQWLVGNRTSPMEGWQMEHLKIIPNKAMKSQIHDAVDCQLEKQRNLLSKRQRAMGI